MTRSVASLLLAFNGSFAITNLALLAAIVRRCGTKIISDPSLRNSLGNNWQLAAAGVAYALGLWIDKIIMWHLAPSGGLLVAGALHTMPSYDTAMFWSQLSSIPIIAVFFVHVETRLSARVQTLYGRMQDRASLRELNEIIGNIGTRVLSSLVGLFAALAAVAGLMIMLSIVFMAELGLHPAYMSILRVSLCSMVFYTSAMFCFSYLLYFDLRRPALLIVLTYLPLNGVLTILFLAARSGVRWIWKYDRLRSELAGRSWPARQGASMAALSRIHNQQRFAMMHRANDTAGLWQSVRIARDPCIAMASRWLVAQLSAFRSPSVSVCFRKSFHGCAISRQE